MDPDRTTEGAELVAAELTSVLTRLAAREWLVTPNALLGDLVPADLIAQDAAGVSRVRVVIAALGEGVFV